MKPLIFPSRWWYLLVVCLGTWGNLAGAAASISPPIFSHDAGFYPYTFKLRLHHQDSGVSIFYTLDGSAPHVEFPFQRTFQHKTSYRRSPKSTDGQIIEETLLTHPYRGPIKLGRVLTGPARYARITTDYSDAPPSHLGAAGADVNTAGEVRRMWGEFVEYSRAALQQMMPSATIPPPIHSRADKGQLDRAIVVRAVAVGPRGERSEVVTNTFFFGSPERFTLPIVSLVADPEDIFDYQRGVFVAGARFDAWRLRTPRFSATAGTADANWRDDGESSERPVHVEFLEKSSLDSRVRVFAQTAGLRVHGAFSRADPQKSIRLHARKRYGKDEISTFGSLGRDFLPKQVVLRNAGNDRLGSLFRDAMGRKLFDGLRVDIARGHNVVVFLNGEYWGHYMLQERIGADHFAKIASVDEADIEISRNYGVTKSHPDMGSEWLNLIQKLESNKGAKGSVVKAAEVEIDVASFVDSHISHVYVGNGDWPYNNMVAWRVSPVSSKGQVGRPFRQWRWPVVDLDMAFYNPDTTRLTDLMSEQGPRARADLAWSTRLFRVLMRDEAFRERFVQRYSDVMNTVVRPERVKGIVDTFHDRMAPEIPSQVHRWLAPKSQVEWEASVEQLRQYVSLRTDHQFDELRTLFGLEAPLVVEVSPLGPDVALWVNGLRYDGNLNQTLHLKYFKGARLALRVENQVCRRFLGWQGHVVHNGSLDIQISGPMKLTPQLAGLCPAPVASTLEKD